MKHTKPFFSIIVPVYKVEEYIGECVDSILAQSFMDFELLLVDDGSPDHCPMICDEYAKKDKRVKVFHKENGGLSDARNKGIKEAIGTYVLFIDSDDFIVDQSLEKIVQVIRKSDQPDIVFLQASRFFQDGTSISYGLKYIQKSIINQRNYIEILEHLAIIPQFHLSACLKAIKSKILIDNNLYFTKGIYHEDADWSVSLYLNARTFAICEYDYYCYRQNREGSIMSAFQEKRFYDTIYIVKKWVELANTQYKEYSREIHLFMYHKYQSLLLMYADKENKNRRYYKKDMKELAWLMDIDERWETTLMRVVYKIFGLRIVSVGLSFYLKEVYHEK